MGRIVVFFFDLVFLSFIMYENFLGFVKIEGEILFLGRLSGLRVECDMLEVLKVYR